MTCSRASLVLLLALVLFGALHDPVAAQETAAESVAARLKRAEGRSGTAAVVVIDLADGKTLLSHNADMLLTPASNMKVLTSAAALCTLGAGFEFVTRVYSRGEIKDSVLEGDLCLVGGGDPNLSGRFYRGDVLKLFREWATRLKESGIGRVKGDLLFDSSLFGGPSFCEGWPQDGQYLNWYCAEVSALAFNDNCLGIKVTPGKEGEPARIEITPATAFVKVINETKTVAGRKAIAVGVSRPRGANVFTVKGTVPGGATWGYSGDFTVTDPALFTATVFAETLKAEGLEVTGQIMPFTMTADELPKFTVRLEHKSTLVQALLPVNTNSQNLHAEMLLRHLGVAFAGKGTFKTGEAALLDFLARQKLSREGTVAVDGSGLAAANRVTANQLAGVLKLMASRKDAEVFKKTMAVGGETGTLEKRMKDRLLKGKVFAKTGYIAGVNALSGYLETGGRTLAFAMLMNNCVDARAALDDIVLMLARAYQ